MRISDWNSDVCSSDLHADPLWLRARQQPEIAATAVGALEVVDALEATVGELPPQGEPSTRLPPGRARVDDDGVEAAARLGQAAVGRGGKSEEHTSELQSLMRNSYAVFCLQKKKQQHTN